MPIHLLVFPFTTPAPPHHPLYFSFSLLSVSSFLSLSSHTHARSLSLPISLYLSICLPSSGLISSIHLHIHLPVNPSIILPNRSPNRSKSIPLSLFLRPLSGFLVADSLLECYPLSRSGCERSVLDGEGEMASQLCKPRLFCCVYCRCHQRGGSS